ncbi:ceramide synthase 6-like [Atheta coriaria]|uniref:ceramide synthase 6-like n=1 Tax=Dalotia coriaria TaxID=877792 RepID=UPI0031F388B0
MNIIRGVSDVFWDSDIWLPPNTTWKDIAPNSNPHIHHADSTHLLYPIPMAMCLFIFRRLFEKYCLSPFGLYLGIKNTAPKKAPANKHLEAAFSRSRYPKVSVIKGLVKQLDWEEIQVERWFRARRLQDKPSTLVKFVECGWRGLYYTLSFIYGWIVLWDKEWLWDIQKCWSNYPHQSVEVSIWWYYMVSLSFYWCLCFTQFIDVKRSDFWQMFAHHLATIALMSFSWVCNMTRIGSLVIFLHDAADIILEAAKMTKYAKCQRICDCMFVIFVPLWTGTRIGVYPLWILRNTMFDAAKIVPMFPAYYIFNSLLIGLLALHVFWTYLMLRILQNTLKTGSMEKDVRSSSEDEDSD